MRKNVQTATTQSAHRQSSGSRPTLISKLSPMWMPLMLDVSYSLPTPCTDNVLTKGVSSRFDHFWDVGTLTIKHTKCSLLWYLNQTRISTDRQVMWPVVGWESSGGRVPHFFACNLHQPQRLLWGRVTYIYDVLLEIWLTFRAFSRGAKFSTWTLLVSWPLGLEAISLGQKWKQVLKSNVFLLE